MFNPERGPRRRGDEGRCEKEPENIERKSPEESPEVVEARARLERAKESFREKDKEIKSRMRIYSTRDLQEINDYLSPLAKEIIDSEEALKEALESEKTKRREGLEEKGEE